jgi:hypothetical protein
MKFIKYKIYRHEYADGSIKYSGVAIFRKNIFSKIRFCLSSHDLSIYEDDGARYFLSLFEPVKYRQVFDDRFDLEKRLKEAIEKKIAYLNANTIIKSYSLC